jgi:hypothetical protein
MEEQEEEKEDETDAGEEEEEGAVITFTLSPSNLLVTVTRQELELLHFVRSKTLTTTGLPPSRGDLEQSFATLMTGAEGKITKSGFDQLCRSLFPQTSATPESERKALSVSCLFLFKMGPTGYGSILVRYHKTDLYSVRHANSYNHITLSVSCCFLCVQGCGGSDSYDVT